MKEKYKKWKEWMQNPRYRALAKLGWWIIFFVIVYFIVISHSPGKLYGGGDEEAKVSNDEIENYVNMTSYEYEYSLTYKENEKNITVIITGTHYDKKDYFTIADREFYDDGTLYEVIRSEKKLLGIHDLGLPISLYDIYPTQVHVWLKMGTLEEEIKYHDETKNTSYFYKIDEDLVIDLSVISNKNYIVSIEIDLVDFLYTKDLQFEKFDVILKYKNINNISSYERNFSEYTIVTESE